MNRIIIICFLLISIQQVDAQNRLLDNQAILDVARDCLSNTYNYKFQEAKENLAIIEKYTEEHPVSSFLKAFIIYWEYYPLVPGHEKEEEFLYLMETCMEISESWVKKEETELEAIFFDLFSRAFYVMYFADNGKPGKVFPHLNTMYRHAMEGFELMEKFNEFYFTTGLYNYYVEAYPQKHPAYKPVVLLFRDGDMPLGLKQLEYCSENAVFLRVEAKFFLALLHLNYEKDLNKASEYAAELYREFPNNSYYAGKYLEILLVNKKYFFAPLILNKLKNWGDPFSLMQYHLYSAYYEEKVNKNYKKAKDDFERALELSEQYKDFTNPYNAIAYMGLGRYYNRNGNQSLANRYFRQANNASSYDYILEDR
jgi:hypothetical protein